MCPNERTNTLKTTDAPFDCDREGNGVAVAAVLLAAGVARRMGRCGSHKLLAKFDGTPLVRRAAIVALQARVSSVTVVTGHRHADIIAALEGLDLRYAQNRDYASGVATSLITGFMTDEAKRADGVLIINADMPRITSEDLDTLIEAFCRSQGQAIVCSAARGRRGNPAVLPRSLYDSILGLRGDVGAQRLIETSGIGVIEISFDEETLSDVNTPEAILAAGGVLGQ